MKTYLMGTRKIKRQQCELCGKQYGYRRLRICNTIDGDILVCSKCYTEVFNEHYDEVCDNINVKKCDYNEMNEVTEEEKIRDVGL